MNECAVEMQAQHGEADFGEDRNTNLVVRILGRERKSKLPERAEIFNLLRTVT